MPDSLQIALRNDSAADGGGQQQQPLYAYITGLALREGGRRCFLRPDGRTLYFPANPPRIGSPLAEDCAIPLGPRPGDVVTVTIPQIAGGRVVSFSTPVSTTPRSLCFYYVFGFPYLLPPPLSQNSLRPAFIAFLSIGPPGSR